MASLRALVRNLVTRSGTRARDRGASLPEYALVLTILVASTVVVLGELDEGTEREVVDIASEIGALPTIVGFVAVETTLPPTTTTTTSSTIPPVSVIKVRVRGDTGAEQLRVLANGVEIGFVSPAEMTQSYVTYVFNHSSAVSISDIEVKFDNNGSFGGADKNVDVRWVNVDGVVHQTLDNPDLYTTGVWTGDYCTSNEYFASSRRLSCNGSFRWIERTPDLDCDWHEFTRTGGFELHRDGSDNNTRHVAVPDGGSGSGYVECLFDVPTAGIYRMQGSMGAPDSGSDSFFVSIDAGPEWLWDVKNSSSFVNDNVNDRGKQDPVLVNLAAGQYNIRFRFREYNTKLRTMTLVYDSAPVTDKLTCVAADFTLIGAFTLTTTGGTPNVVVPDGSGDSYGSASTTDRATCVFTVTDPGDYRIEGLVRAPSGTSDSFWGIWQGETFQWWPGMDSGGAFFTSWVEDKDVGTPYESYLGAGDHTFVIANREDGTHLSTLTLVKQ